jgi:transposase
VEVDYAGDPIEWVDLKTGEIYKAFVFVAALGFSQLLFARAAEDMKSRNWLGCHRRMFAFYGGVSHVTVVVFLSCWHFSPSMAAQALRHRDR